MRLGEWPGWAGLRVLMLWVVLVFVVFAWRPSWSVARAVADDGSVAPFSITTPLLVAFGPPALFAIGYGVSRRLRSRTPRSSPSVRL